MLEEKIEELKSEQSHEIKKRPCSTQIDLMISAQIDDNYFLSETDKIQFYREIELVESIEDLEHLRQNFFSREEDIPEVSKNLFLLLECKILAQKHDITSIKRVGVNYQIDFSPEMTLERLKDFLTLDSEVKFHVVDISRLRSPTKGFVNDKIFIEYLLRLLQGTITPQKKIRLARKI